MLTGFNSDWPKCSGPLLSEHAQCTQLLGVLLEAAAGSPQSPPSSIWACSANIPADSRVCWLCSVPHSMGALKQ